MTIGSARAMFTVAVPAADRARLHASRFSARPARPSVATIGLARLLGLLSDP
jgi:hypothetical protein